MNEAKVEAADRALGQEPPAITVRSVADQALTITRAAAVVAQEAILEMAEPAEREPTQTMAAARALLAAQVEQRRTIPRTSVWELAAAEEAALVVGATSQEAQAQLAEDCSHWIPDTSGLTDRSR